MVNLEVCNNGCTVIRYMDNLPPSGSPVLTITDPTIGYAQIYDIWPIGSVHTWAVYDSTNTAVTGTVTLLVRLHTLILRIGNFFVIQLTK